MPRLSNNDRNQALGMLRAGISPREVARLFKRHIKKFTGIFWRSTLLTITFNQALFFFGNFSKKKNIF
jgi:hypothetical protein